MKKEDKQLDVIPLGLINDEPVAALVDDRLSLEAYADTVAAVALGTEGPFTIGVFGTWGHGKTSLLGLARTMVDGQRRENVTTVWFNAWQYEKEEHPIVPLTATIIRALERKYAGTVTAGLKKGAGALIRALRAVAYGFSGKTTLKIPGVAEVEAGFVAKEMIERDEELKKQSVDPLLDQSLYHNAFQLLARLHDKESKEEDRPRIVVFIDDLDRCLPENALHLLESIKLVLAQPGFIFVLAIDRRVVESYLDKRYKEKYGLTDYPHGQSYLDKIIQLPFDIPSHVDRFEVFIGKMLDREELSDLADDFRPLQSIIGPACDHNPRQVVRFFNRMLIDRHIWRRRNPDEAFDAGAFAVARSLQDQCARAYRLLLLDEVFCQAIFEGPEKTEDCLYRLRREGSRAEALEREDKRPTEGLFALIRWTKEHDQAVADLVRRWLLCKLLDSGPGRRWLEKKELRNQIEQFLEVERREEARTGEEEERSVPEDILRAIEAAEKAGPIADPDSKDYWVTIPAGKFLMGAQKADDSEPNHDADAYTNESPVHGVTLGAYRIGRYPVTVAEYEKFRDAGGYSDERYWKDGGFGKWKSPVNWDEQKKHPNRPVTQVSWYEAAAYAAWKGARLPTEAEWERAARGSEARRYPWGDDKPTPRRANFGVLLERPSPVGVYIEGATPDGIHDLAGNVWEWCSDWYGPYPGDAQENPKGPPSGDGRVFRGGSWHYLGLLLRSAFRAGCGPAYRAGFIGFRVAAGT